MDTRILRKRFKNNFYRAQNKKFEVKKYVLKYLIKICLSQNKYYLLLNFLNNIIKQNKSRLFSIIFLLLFKQSSILMSKINFLDIKTVLCNWNYVTNFYYFQRFSRDSSISLIKNVCVFTGRTRGVFSFFKLSRLKLKEFGTTGLLPGIRRSSW